MLPAGRLWYHSAIPILPFWTSLFIDDDGRTGEIIEGIFEFDDDFFNPDVDTFEDDFYANFTFEDDFYNGGSNEYLASL